MITLASQLLEKTVSSNASDVFIVAGLPVSMRLNGIIVHEDEERLKPNDTARLLNRFTRWQMNATCRHFLLPEMMIFHFPFRDFPVSVSVPSNREVLYPPSSE